MLILRNFEQIQEVHRAIIKNISLIDGSIFRSRDNNPGEIFVAVLLTWLLGSMSKEITTSLFSSKEARSMLA